MCPAPERASQSSFPGHDGRCRPRCNPMPPKVLVVDDEPNIVSTLRPLLRSRGYDVLTAMTGCAALEAVERDVPDVIVLDLGLPDLDGAEVCRMIRETHRIPIVVLSARGAEGDKVRALDLGA